MYRSDIDTNIIKDILEDNNKGIEITDIVYLGNTKSKSWDGYPSGLCCRVYYNIDDNDKQITYPKNRIELIDSKFYNKKLREKKINQIINES